MRWPVARVENTISARMTLAAEIRNLRPRVVILPYWEGRHPDHYKASEIGYESCFLSGLRKLDEEKNGFVDGAGQALRNLIGSLIMSNNMVKDEDYRLSTDQREFVQYIGDSAEKMQYMLNKLMDVKEIESPELKFSMEIFDINAEVQNVFKGLVETAQMKNIHLVDNILKLPLNAL